jgi:hypothetical protein
VRRRLGVAQSPDLSRRLAINDRYPDAAALHPCWREWPQWAEPATGECLGGLYSNGLNRWSILGAFADKGIKGFGFQFVEAPGAPRSKPVGLDGVQKPLCPPCHGGPA